MPPTGADIAEQLGWHWNAQLRPRLDGLTDDEYLWEPVSGAWSMRRRADGRYAPDWAWPTPEPAPVTTIGWRVAHIWFLLVSRHNFHFGDRTVDVDRLDWPGTADVGLAALDDAYATWMAAVAAMSAGDFERHSQGPPGTADGHYPFWAVVQHVNREVIHHGAEIALLRDLYAHRSG